MKEVNAYVADSSNSLALAIIIGLDSEHDSKKEENIQRRTD